MKVKCLIAAGLSTGNIFEMIYDALEEIYVKNDGTSFVIRSRTQGDADKAIQAAGVALGPTERFVE